MAVRNPSRRRDDGARRPSVGSADPVGSTGSTGGGPPAPVARRWSVAVADLAFLALTLAVFALLALVVRALEKL